MSYAYPRFSATPNCVGVPTEFFFTEGSAGKYPNLPYLQAICGSCPVLNECLDYALHVQVQGWWGNTSEKQRDRMRVKLGITAETMYDTYYFSTVRSGGTDRGNSTVQDDEFFGNDTPENEKEPLI